MLLTLQSELGSKAVHENSLLIKSTLFGSPIFSDSVGFELFEEFLVREEKSKCQCHCQS